MSKVFLSTLVAALVCVAVSSAQAANGISAGTLDAMGISGMTVMSDSDGLAIRGKGFNGFDCENCGRPESSARAFGNSFATMNLESCPDCVAIDGSSHSENGYISEGSLFASGTNFSEAGAVFSTVESIDVGGAVTTVTNTTTARVFAGGFSTARAF
jgi:hypothetical protein